MDAPGGRAAGFLHTVRGGKDGACQDRLGSSCPPASMNLSDGCCSLCKEKGVKRPTT